jgi:nicotinamide mononucleotide transporter
MGLTFQINVSLIAFRRISNWFFGLITVILSGIYFLHTGLNGTAILYLFFYIPMNIAGFFMWIKRSDKIKLDEVVPMKISREGFISFIISIAILAVFSYLLIYYQVSIDFLTTGHYLDFLSVLFGIFGQVFTNMASALQWIPWVFVNGIIVIVYATQVNLSMVALFTIALANAIIGLRFWLRKD